MSDLKEPINTLKDKVEQLISSHGELQNRLQALVVENDELKKELASMPQIHNGDGANNNLANLAHPISGNGHQNNDELKLIITNLVKEIDDCIALLGKNV